MLAIARLYSEDAFSGIILSKNLLYFIMIVVACKLLMDIAEKSTAPNCVTKGDKMEILELVSRHGLSLGFLILFSLNAKKLLLNLGPFFEAVHRVARIERRNVNVSASNFQGPEKRHPSDQGFPLYLNETLYYAAVILLGIIFSILGLWKGK